MNDSKPEDPESSFWGNAVLLIVTIGFLIGLVPMAKMAFAPLVSSYRAASWEAGDAIIISSFIDVPHRRQYRLETAYQYQWNGADYRSTRVFFDETVGVRKSYYQQVNRTLLNHRSDGTPMTIWINPGHPAQSVIFRHIRWDKVAANLGFFAIWSLITFGLTGALVATLRK